MAKVIDVIKVEKKAVGEKYNAFQSGYGVHGSTSYDRKSRKAKTVKAIKDYENGRY